MWCLQASEAELQLQHLAAEQQEANHLLNDPTFDSAALTAHLNILLPQPPEPASEEKGGKEAHGNENGGKSSKKRVRKPIDMGQASISGPKMGIPLLRRVKMAGNDFDKATQLLHAEQAAAKESVTLLKQSEQTAFFRAQKRAQTRQGLNGGKRQHQNQTNKHSSSHQHQHGGGQPSPRPPHGQKGSTLGAQPAAGNNGPSKTNDKLEETTASADDKTSKTGNPGGEKPGSVAAPSHKNTGHTGAGAKARKYSDIEAAKILAGDPSAIVGGAAAVGSKQASKLFRLILK